MKRSLFATFLLLAIVGTADATEAGTKGPVMEPLSHFTQRLISGKPDVSDLAYVGNRCAALLTAMATYLKANGTTEQDKAMEKNLVKRAVTYLTVAQALDPRINKSPETSRAQLELFVGIYVNSINENKLLNNSFMSPLIAEDIEAANSLFPVFEELAKEIKKQ